MTTLYTGIKLDNEFHVTYHRNGSLSLYPPGAFEGMLQPIQVLGTYQNRDVKAFIIRFMCNKYAYNTEHGVNNPTILHVIEKINPDMSPIEAADLITNNQINIKWFKDIKIRNGVWTEFKNYY